MQVINSIASWFLKKRIYQIESFIEKPIETQNQVFRSLMEMGKHTEFGKTHRFQEIDSVKTFQELVPISSYEDLYPYISRVLEGEKDVLWPGEVRWFSKSSGTTNAKSKFIPLSKESLNECHFEAGKDMLAIYLNQKEDSNMFSGKALSIGGSHEINKLNTRASYGDLSSVLIENMPLFFELFRSPSKKVALMSEWEEKLRQMAVESMSKNVVNIVGVPTWTLVLINKIFEISGNTDRNLLDIWPNLELFVHGGMSFEPYRDQFSRIIPSDQMQYFETYNASEGFFGIQYELGKGDLLLMLDYGIFYEFVPTDQIENEKPEAYTLDQVEVGKNYAMVISTNGGLWRYLLGDTVKFTSLDPHRIKITGRVKHFINAFGEELMIENADAAISKAGLETGAVIENYTAAPVFFEGGQNGCHEWLIEFSVPPINLSAFQAALDEFLKEINSDYEAKRYKNLALRPPMVNVAPMGTFYKWLRSKNKLGGQHKVPRLCNSREYIDEIKSVLDTV